MKYGLTENTYKKIKEIINLKFSALEHVEILKQIPI